MLHVLVDGRVNSLLNILVACSHNIWVIIKTPSRCFFPGRRWGFNIELVIMS